MIIGVVAPLVARPSLAQTAQGEAGGEARGDVMAREEAETERRREDIAAEIARMSRHSAPGHEASRYG